MCAVRCVGSRRPQTSQQLARADAGSSRARALASPLNHAAIASRRLKSEAPTTSNQSPNTSNFSVGVHAVPGHSVNVTWPTRDVSDGVDVTMFVATLDVIAWGISMDEGPLPAAEYQLEKENLDPLPVDVVQISDVILTTGVGWTPAIKVVSSCLAPDVSARPSTRT